MILDGTVERIIFRNEQNGYAVFALRLAQESARSMKRASITVAGPAGAIQERTTVRVEGELADTRFGQQVRLTAWEELIPQDVEGIEAYLASGLIKNIGPVTAKLIVGHFGKDTLDVLDNHPERLKEVKGIGPVRLKAIIVSAEEQKEIRSIMIWLKKHDLPNGLSAKIYSTYGRNSIHLLTENPYRLADDINGVGFKKADAAARNLGIPEDSEFRILSGLLQVVKDHTEKGHSYIERDTLIPLAASEEYLGLPVGTVEAVYGNKLLRGEWKRLQDEGGCVYLPYMLKAERFIAAKLLSMVTDPDGGEAADVVDFGAIERSTGVHYAEAQRQAVRRALGSGVFVLTGGPGTGKTVTTNAILRAALSAGGEKVRLAAPTGKAAKRMEEVTGMPASTIHRLLGAGKEGFSYNEDNPLACDLLVVDEFSMVDLPLMNALLKAVPEGMRLILVGDVDQLPSVGPGSVLRDMLDSGVIPSARLTEVFRQAQDSDIVMNAHAVHRGEMPRVRPDGKKDFFFVNVPDKEALSGAIVDLVANRIPAKGVYTPADIQVLTPMRRDWDPIGSTVLNQKLQEALNPQEKKIVRGATEFRLGDKVMQVANNYDMDVFNGDSGVVSAVNPDEGSLVVTFGPGHDVLYKRANLGELELSYAATIHKSQGSEYPVVIIPVHESQAIMLLRNLLYTGITRARRLCILAGTRKAVFMAVSREDTRRRQSGLADRLRGDIPGNLALGGNTTPGPEQEPQCESTLF